MTRRDPHHTHKGLCSAQRGNSNDTSCTYNEILVGRGAPKILTARTSTRTQASTISAKCDLQARAHWDSISLPLCIVSHPFIVFLVRVLPLSRCAKGPPSGRVTLMQQVQRYTITISIRKFHIQSVVICACRLYQNWPEEQVYVHRPAHSPCTQVITA